MRALIRLLVTNTHEKQQSGLSELALLVVCVSVKKREKKTGKNEKMRERAKKKGKRLLAADCFIIIECSLLVRDHDESEKNKSKQLYWIDLKCALLSPILSAHLHTYLRLAPSDLWREIFIYLLHKL